MIKVSIIIPVYKAEKYIERCVRSLFNQTLNCLEYIFVDDCSPDNSIGIMKNILNEYPNRKTQVKVIKHAQNTGVSQSRQDGTDIATGEYIIHCDPDDWVDPYMYEDMYKKALKSNADIIICDFFCESQTGTKYYNQDPLFLNGLSILESITGVNNKFLHGALWNKLIKSDIYKKSKFPNSINYCEDVFILFNILSQNKLKIDYLNKAYYHYFMHTESIVHRANVKTLELDKKLLFNLNSIIGSNNTLYKCYQSFAIAIIYNRVFLKNYLTSYQFKLAFGNYIKYINCNKRISIIDRILLYVSMRGFYKLAIQIRNLLAKGNKLITTILH